MLEITKKDERFNDVKFVAKAVSKDDTRKVLTYVCSNGKRLLACDGFRVHAVKMEFPKGYYKVIVNNGSKIILDDATKEFEENHPKYPDIKAIWPRKAKTILNEIYCSSSKDKDFFVTAKLLRAMDEKQTINTIFLDDICSSMDHFVVKQEKETEFSSSHPLLFQNGNKRAIVMPIRM
jgi:hypothetical protein